MDRLKSKLLNIVYETLHNLISAYTLGSLFYILSFKKMFIGFREREREGEGERKRGHLCEIICFETWLNGTLESQNNSYIHLISTW